jgi:hypothetical protein
VASPDILDERMTGGDHRDAVVPLEPAHRSQSCLQPAVVALDPIVGAPVGAVPRRYQPLLQHHRIGRCSVGDDLGGPNLGRAGGLAEEPAGGTGVPPRGDKYVTTCPNWSIARYTYRHRPATFVEVSSTNQRSVAHGVPAGSGGLSQQRREPQHPPVDGDMVDLDTPLGEQLLDVAIGQSKAQVPANRQHDHIGREAEAGEGGARRDRLAGAVSGSHTRSLTAVTA